jgi:hypothetical protein
MPVPVTSNVFGRMLTASQLELAALAVIEEWIGDYCEEMEKQLGWTPGTLVIPTNYANRNSFDINSGEAVPKVIAISPGTQGPPVMAGHNVYRAIWRLGIGVATAAKTEEIANDQIKAYAAVVCKILLDKQTLGGFPGISQIIWNGTTFDDLPIVSQIQQFKGAGVDFLVDVENVVTARHGPTTHHQPSYGQVEEVIIDLEKDPIIP